MKILLVLLLLPFVSISQPYDTMWLRRTFNGVPNNTFLLRPLTSATQTKFTYYPQYTDSTTGVIQTATRLKVKTDSLAAALAAANAILFDAKQNTLVSGTNIKTVNGNNILGTGDVPISGSAAWGSVTGTLSNQTDLNNALNGKLATNGSAASLTNFPTFNQNTTGTAAGLSAILSFASGGISGAAATPATTGAMTVPMTSTVITITPTGACTFNASGGVAGQRVTFAVTTSGTTSFVLTFGTNFRKVGTLATGTVSARFFSVTFICINGTIWQEIGRTAAQT